MILTRKVRAAPAAAPQNTSITTNFGGKLKRRTQRGNWLKSRTLLFEVNLKNGDILGLRYGRRGREGDEIIRASQFSTSKIRASQISAFLQLIA